MARYDDLTVDWLGYATTRIEGNDAVVYMDPGRYGTLDGTWAEQYGNPDHPSGDAYAAHDADVILVTHDHHYDDDGIERVASDDATIVVYEAVSAEGVKANSGRDVREPEALPYKVCRVAYGDELTINGIDIDVVPAYNRPDGPRANEDVTVPHPRGFGCGFLVTVDGTSCFWPGDSDVIAEHEDLEVSVLLPSIAESFTMNRHDAADLAADLDPDLVLPIHYNTFPALESDSGAFVVDVAKHGIPVVLEESGF